MCPRAHVKVGTSGCVSQPDWSAVICVIETSLPTSGVSPPFCDPDPDSLVARSTARLRSTLALPSITTSGDLENFIFHNNQVFRSKEDDVARISTSIYITNFPESFSAKDLFHSCKVYGHVVDSFIPWKRSKEGKRFGFVQFINVFNIERLEVVDAPAIVLDETCFNTKEISTSLIARMKEFAAISNLKKVLRDEGFDELKIKYLGELWVLLEFPSNNVKDAFRTNVGVSSWFSVLRQASYEFLAEVKITWIDVEGIPFKFWSSNTFDKIASKWGKLMDIDDHDETCFYSKRLCLFTKVYMNIFESFKLVFRGKTYWIRAKEVSGWILEFEEESDDDEISVDGNDIKEHNDGEELDVEEVPETVFEEFAGIKEGHSKDPFGLNLLLNKEKSDGHEKSKESDHSLKFPSGFTLIEVKKEVESREEQNKETDGDGMGDMLNGKLNDQEGNSATHATLNVNSEATSSGRFKNSKVPRNGGSILDLLEEVVKVGKIIGYKMDRCEDNITEIIESQGAAEGQVVGVQKGKWLGSRSNLLIVVVYAPHDARDKRILWDYLTHVSNQWDGEVVMMGDFNEVRNKSERFGSVFYSHGADIFNSFINEAGLEEVPLGGSRYTWCHRSATKMSKPILLRESACDNGPIPFRFFHYWMDVEGFDKLVVESWMVAPIVGKNSIQIFMSKLKFLKTKIKDWVVEYKRNMSGLVSNLKQNLVDLDAKIDKGKGDDVIVSNRLEIINQIQGENKIKALETTQKAKIRWYVEGDENNKFFHGMLNKKCSQLNIRGIMINGKWTDEPVEVKREFFQHFSEPITNRASIDMNFPNTLSLEQKEDLERNISIEEAVQYFFNHGDIPKGCNSNFIMLIPKIPDANCVLGNIVNEVQSAFITDRQILDGPFIINEVMQWCKHKKKQALIFKVIFEKAYDSVRCDYLDEVLDKFGFEGLRINMGKSKIMGIHVDNANVASAAYKLGCLIMKTPFVYLGTKVGGNMSRVVAWKEVLEKVMSRLSKWKLKTFSIGGRFTLLKSILGSTPIFHMSIFKVPLSVVQKLEAIRSYFFHGHDRSSNKASWVKWSKVLTVKDKGGLGVPSLYALNSESLWSRVIKAIHGNKGRFECRRGIRTRSCWTAIILEVKKLQSKGINFFEFMQHKMGNEESTKF
uniref:RNA-directed DNA polymerase, eukaryota n=1 Tax=Tanacetum cinerariifolium TaxID=118510 RepID=A0A6L2LHI6_TANCI|nr:RNA-directed DNA polymerase, eukaryota [Tanacetum cinerariifolium]